MRAPQPSSAASSSNSAKSSPKPWNGSRAPALAQATVISRRRRVGTRWRGYGGSPPATAAHHRQLFDADSGIGEGQAQRHRQPCLPHNRPQSDAVFGEIDSSGITIGRAMPSFIPLPDVEEMPQAGREPRRPHGGGGKHRAGGAQGRGQNKRRNPREPFDVACRRRRGSKGKGQPGAAAASRAPSQPPLPLYRRPAVCCRTLVRCTRSVPKGTAGG